MTAAYVRRRAMPTLRRLRPLVSLRNEYRLRRLVSPLVPVAGRASVAHVYHCCTWKTASQWVRLILSDPRIHRSTGLEFDLYGERDGEVFRHLRRQPDRFLASPLYCSYPQFEQLVVPGEFRAFFVTRDPRDLLVSWYFSNAVSHRPNPAVLRRRERLGRLTEEEGLIDQINSDFHHVADMIGTWTEAAAHDERLRVVRYEKLTGPGQLETWRSLFEFCGFDVPDPTIAAVLGTYRIEHMTGVADHAQSDRTQKYRAHATGDWQEHFTADVERAFLANYAHLLDAP